MKRIYRHLIPIAGALLFLLFSIGHSYGQKYAFTHYDIEDGLIQSQVNKVYQDASHRLWIGTLGGACRFDGRDYFQVSKSTGLGNNFVYSVFCDSRDRTWLGTNKGLYCLQNDKIVKLTVAADLRIGWVNRTVEDGQGTIWASMNNQLIRVDNNRITGVRLPGEETSVGGLGVDNTGRLWVFKYRVGLLRHNNGKWEKALKLPAAMPDIFISKISFDRKSGTAYLLSPKGVFVSNKDSVSAYQPEVLANARPPFISMALEDSNTLWLGATNGAYRVKNGQLTHFGSGNGLTGNSVSDIYRDRDGNIWLGTQGSGLYKYEGDEYVIYNSANAIVNTPIVMGITANQRDKVLLGTDGGGLLGFDGKNLRAIWAALTPYGRKVETLFSDKDNNVWIGTSMGGLWKYDGKTVNVIKGTEENSIVSIKQDDDGSMMLGTPHGLYFYKDGNLTRAEGLDAFISSIIKLGKDTLLLGSQDGPQMVVNRTRVKFSLPGMGSTGVLSVLKHGRYVFWGTDDSGLFIWDRNTGKVKNYQAKDGLKSNSIYSLALDSSGMIWTGTGRGVNKFRFIADGMRIQIIGGTEPREQITEANQNAILLYNGQMLVGTTKGLAVYNTTLAPQPPGKPFIIINSVKLFEEGNQKPRLIYPDEFGKNLVLNADENHLAISFLGVYLKSPENVTYQYRLSGLEDKFSAPMKNDVVDFPSLPSGKYTFEVRALTRDGQVSENTASFSFEITPPFYQTYLFRLGVILALILIGVLGQNYFHQRKIQRQVAIEKMKREEKMKIRQQTAEDFHDDLGNKLTRITVLSDILDAKLAGEATDERNLVTQIKQNAAALYNGTRDILWAMDPKSDNLFEVLTHVKDIGTEIFQDVPVLFDTTAISAELAGVKLPMEYSRNITMIFKESFNNILKHADARNVKFTHTVDKNEARLTVTDDGKGFAMDAVGSGHGLNNIKRRAKRIGADLNISSGKDTGTMVELVFALNKKV